jgi:hypothetical protein
MISLDLLREAMQPLIEVGKDEIEFDAFGTPVALRPLLPKEEVLVQRAAAVVVEQNRRFEKGLREQTGGEDTAETDSMTRASALDYFDRFRVEVISHALVQVGGLNLRGAEFIATGETLPNGNPVKVAKPVAVRPLVENWSRAMISLVFAKYGELMDRLNKAADTAVEDSPADLDAEIDRLETRLAEAKTERAKRAGGDPSITPEQIGNFVGLGANMEEGAKQAAALPSAREVNQQLRKAENQPAPAQPRRSVLPPTVPPPTPDPVPVKYNLPPEPPAPSAFDEAVAAPSSFGGGDLEALAAEEERILLARQKAAQSRGTPASPSPVKDALSQAQPVGMVQGMEAYRLPTEAISERGRRSAPPATPSAGVNPAPADTRNPNFRPVKR